MCEREQVCISLAGTRSFQIIIGAYYYLLVDACIRLFISLATGLFWRCFYSTVDKSPPPTHPQGTSVQASIDGKMVTTQTITQGAGFVGFGVGGFYAALFDDFSVMAGKTVP